MVAEVHPAAPARAPASTRSLDSGWRDAFWAAAIVRLDAQLRRWQHIEEFTNDENCVLRLGPGIAGCGFVLADGTRIGGGQKVGVLHIWNEHLPRFRAGGPDLCWAAAMRRGLSRSMRELARFAEVHPMWQQVPAFRADPLLSARLGAEQVERVAARYGFERVATPATLLRQMQRFGDCLNSWGLTRAYNPAALRRQALLRDRHELWISRTALLKQYGSRAAD